MPRRKLFSISLVAINILVNGAGGNMPGATIPTDKTFLDLKIDDFQKVVELNLTGSVLPSQILAEPIMAAKSGCIINISSMAAYLPITRVWLDIQWQKRRSAILHNGWQLKWQKNSAKVFA